MTDEEKGKRLITVKIESDVHIALRMLAKRYKKKKQIKGKVSLSDALRFFVQDHEPDLANTAEEQAEQQDDFADE